jgi:glyoxylase-like metal-dependent hydrolase (beta-lactamase superfamily II)/rhodanese-related sulfurtransferase
MLFRQLFDLDSSTYTYILADDRTREAVIIDAVIEQLARDCTLIEELELNLRYVLDTHVHADHVTASSLLRDRFAAKAVVSERSGVVSADRLVKHGDAVEFGHHELRVRETPGHTNGCVTFVSEDSGRAFTGDALLIRGCGRTDFQGGDSATLYRSVHEQIFSLPPDTTLYPAHDYKGRTATSVREEQRWNPRLGGARSLAEFQRVMDELKLPYPRKIDVAVPANSRGGRQPDATVEAAPRPTPDWAPIDISLAGVPELGAEWLRDHPDAATLIDVREPDEYSGELGHLADAQLIPLTTLRAAAARLPKDRPIVAVCRSGGRSGRAALELAQLGFGQVASLRGGMLQWNAKELPVEFGASRHASASRQG